MASANLTSSDLCAGVERARSSAGHTLDSLSEATGIPAARLEALEAGISRAKMPELVLIARATSRNLLELTGNAPVLETAGTHGPSTMDAPVRGYLELDARLDDEAIPDARDARPSLLDRTAGALGIDQNSAEQRRADALVANDVELLRALRDLRRRKGLTRPEVGERMGVSHAAVAEFEADGANPDLSTIRRYAHAIGARLTASVTDDEEA